MKHYISKFANYLRQFLGASYLSLNAYITKESKILISWISNQDIIFKKEQKTIQKVKRIIKIRMKLMKQLTKNIKIKKSDTLERQNQQTLARSTIRQHK